MFLSEFVAFFLLWPGVNIAVGYGFDDQARKLIEIKENIKRCEKAIISEREKSSEITNSIKNFEKTLKDLENSVIGLERQKPRLILIRDQLKVGAFALEHEKHTCLDENIIFNNSYNISLIE